MNVQTHYSFFYRYLGLDKPHKRYEQFIAEGYSFEPIRRGSRHEFLEDVLSCLDIIQKVSLFYSSKQEQDKNI